MRELVELMQSTYVGPAAPPPSAMPPAPAPHDASEPVASADEWVRLVPTRETIEAAKRDMAADRAAEGGPGLFDKEGWHGNLGEEALTRWLVLNGVAAKRNGRVSSLPDVEAGPVGIGVKTRARMPPGVLIVPERHVHHPWDWWFWCAWDEPAGALYLVGGMPAAAFREVARRYETFAGNAVPCRTVGDHDARLVGPRAFLESVRRTS